MENLAQVLFKEKLDDVKIDDETCDSIVNENGFIKKIEKVDNEKSLIITYNNNNKEKVDGIVFVISDIHDALPQGIKDGYYLICNVHNVILCTADVINGKIEGKLKEYDGSGNKKFEGEFKNGDYYNGYIIQEENGKISTRREIKKGKLCEEEEFYDGVSGKLIDSVNYTKAIVKNNHEVKPIDKKNKIVVYLGGNDSQLTKYTVKRISRKYGEENVQFIFGCKYKTSFLGEPEKQELTDEENNIEKYDTPICTNNCNKMEVFISDHGTDSDDNHPLSSIDVKLISDKISDAIVNSNGKIQTLTIKLLNCYGRTYDEKGIDFKAEILKDIYNKIKEKAEKEKKEVVFDKLPTILISGAKINSISFLLQTIDNNQKYGLRRISFKEYFIFQKEQWEKVWQEIPKYHKENKNEIKEANSINIQEKNNIEQYKKENQYLIDLFNETTKEKYREEKHKQIDNDTNIDINTIKQKNIEK